MGERSGRRRGKGEREERRVVATNRKARHEYELLERLEAGIELRGSEVKSLREVGCDLTGAYGRILDGEAFLVGWEIPPYPHARHDPHDPERPKRLLLHRREIRKWVGRLREKGITIVPLSVYFKNGRAKVEIALARGRKIHDRRARTAEREARREMRRAEGRRRKRA